MSFLLCNPAVCVINDEYEILLNATANGLFSVQIGQNVYYPENSGVLSSEKKTAKIRVKQAVLDKEKKYTVLFKEAIDRKGYFSVIGEQQSQEYAFKPLEKTENIHIYHIADVHYGFTIAKQTAKYFGDDTDLFVFNGDIGEVEKEEHYLETLKFLGEVAKGEIPMFFVRGNHDTRGKLAEKFVEYFPANGYETFYEFKIGCLQGIVFDCGEDKVDDHMATGYPNPDVYAGVNVFQDYRQRELRWLQERTLDKDKITFAIGHICPCMTTFKAGNDFDIERDTYTLWNKELERLGVSFMLCGHLHRAFILDEKDERNLIPHTYPVIFGSQLCNEKYQGGAVSVDKFYGAALTLNSDKVEVSFVDQNFEPMETTVLKLK